MNLPIFVVLSILGQLLMTISFAREALTTDQGTFCRVKCAIAGFLYLFVAILLAWLLFETPTLPTV
ncbi:hypothetical protein [Spirosoma sordidisoli]|uniref:Uncharacterized protein n=1 Tax=Spirosoma sordidisoli TaxID=2502893 RepID=A0A4Q2UJ34_9BACT|nr:hypothetical protein [Spirosoma sordidisoli]RYC68602.1 hypothetical protein EQG79_19855 [Spirosoma sordidisoli]